MEFSHLGKRIAYRVAAMTMTSAALAALSAQPASHGYFTATDGLSIHYLAMGAHQGDPVILLPGYGQWAFYWLRKGGLGSELASDHRVFAMDLRGHGQSAKPHDARKYGPRMSQDIIDLLNHLGLQSAHVHGFGLGGALLARLLESHQHRLISAIFGGSGIPETEPTWATRVPSDAHFNDPRERAYFNSAVSRAMSDDKALDALRNYPWDVGAGLEGYVRSAALEVDLTRVEIPVLGIIGEYDRPNERTHRMIRELADFRRVVVPDRGHLGSLESRAYNQAAAWFIRKHASQQP